MDTVIESLQKAVEEIAVVMRRGGLWEKFGEKHSDKNTSGDQQEHVDVIADKFVAQYLMENPNVCGFASEEREDITRKDSGRYLVAYDPLDGSQNIKVNITTGMIFGIFDTPDRKSPMSGRQLVAAGYAVFGAATQFVVATKAEGVRFYTLCPTHQRFVLQKERHMIPKKGKVYACNEGLQPNWVSPRSRKWAEAMRGRSVRWMACMVSDVHRILVDGGAFLLPADKKNTNGKLRLVYEAYPMAFVYECAGGVATLEDGTPLLDIPFPATKATLHKKVPVFLSSPYEASVYAKL